MLQEIAVVAGDFSHQALRANSESRPHELGITPRMLDPTVGVGGKVCVLGEDVRWRDILLELHQKALSAHPGM